MEKLLIGEVIYRLRKKKLLPKNSWQILLEYPQQQYLNGKVELHIQT
ncbi:hypothetical protein UT300006_01140 [Clostridium sp. CTA-6]